jgi:hypothetical protein
MMYESFLALSHEDLASRAANLMQYIDRAKVEAQRLGRITGQPLDEFLSELNMEPSE